MVVVRSAASLVSAGTERTAAEFARKSLLGKALARPELVRQLLEKARTQGVLSAWDAARARLGRPLQPGYSCAGTVVEVGAGVTDLRPGDRVACAGAGHAVHAELVCVPRNLVARVPDGLDLEAAAFTTVGAIALHAVRLADVELGERVAVIGLGVIGLIAAQLARAAGCLVLGIDVNPGRVALGRELGLERAVVHGRDDGESDDVGSVADALTAGRGLDAVLVTAATSSSEPIRLAGELCRDRGRVVVVGAVGMEVPRGLFYAKELDLRVARSYGPGRYDPGYEEGGHDYPLGYVRWTENRNMEAFLALLSQGEVKVAPLATHRFPIQEGARAYALIGGESREPYLAILLTYPAAEEEAAGASAVRRRVELRGKPTPELPAQPARGAVHLGLLGAGNFATGTLLPAMVGVEGTELVGVCTASGASARLAADRFGFRYCATEEAELLRDPDITAILIATRHHLHAGQVEAALGAGRHVFCEKPLCLDEDELSRIVRTFLGAVPRPQLLVGYNRRFAPFARALKAFVAEAGEPVAMHYRVSAGFLPAEHWIQDPAQGGGRVLGEVCHFVDFLTFLAGEPPAAVYARALPNGGRYRDDNVVISLEFASGSVGGITYVANGDPTLGKERIEVFGGGATAVLDDFRSLVRLHGGKRAVDRARLRQDKGHRGEWEAFVRAVREGGPAPIPFEELVSTSLATFRILESLKSGVPQRIDPGEFVDRAVSDQGGDAER